MLGIFVELHALTGFTGCLRLRAEAGWSTANGHDSSTPKQKAYQAKKCFQMGVSTVPHIWLHRRRVQECQSLPGQTAGKSELANPGAKLRRSCMLQKPERKNVASNGQPSSR